MTVLLAHTRAVGSYPSYLNITQDEADVVVTVREAPIVREGVYVCAHKRDAGPGRCVAGGPTCNNYCNAAPEKGPMQDRPLPCTHTEAGRTVTVRVPASIFAGMSKVQL